MLGARQVMPLLNERKLMRPSLLSVAALLLLVGTGCQQEATKQNAPSSPQASSVEGAQDPKGGLSPDSSLIRENGGVLDEEIGTASMEHTMAGTQLQIAHSATKEAFIDRSKAALQQLEGRLATERQRIETQGGENVESLRTRLGEIEQRVSSFRETIKEYSKSDSNPDQPIKNKVEQQVNDLDALLRGFAQGQSTQSGAS